MNDYGAGEPIAGGPGDGEQWFEEARRRVKTPGFLLQIFGAVCVAICVMYTVANLLNAEGMINAYYDWVEDMQKKQPPEQRQKLPPRDEALHIGPAEVEMPDDRVAQQVVPGADTGERRVHHDPAAHAIAILRGDRVAHHVADVVRDQRSGRDAEVVQHGRDVGRLRLLVVAACGMGRKAH